MNPIATSETGWGQLVQTLPPYGAVGSKSVPGANGAPALREGWQAIIDGPLAEWDSNPETLEDEGVEAPPIEIIQLAAQVAGDLRDAGWPAPQRVAATGDGGIVFARQEGPLFSTIEVASDRSVELVVVENAKLVARRRLK